MEEWYDNMPENFQSSSKGEEVETCRDVLEELVGNLDQCEWGIDFPGMY